jgi:bacterioferritin-associated ferredoxin
MIVCVCKAVSDRHIRAAVKDGATSLRDISRELGVGTCCGKCVPEAQAALAASLRQCASSGRCGESVAPAFFSSPRTEFAV